MQFQLPFRRKHFIFSYWRVKEKMTLVISAPAAKAVTWRNRSQEESGSLHRQEFGKDLVQNEVDEDGLGSRGRGHSGGGTMQSTHPKAGKPPDRRGVGRVVSQIEIWPDRSEKEIRCSQKPRGVIGIEARYKIFKRLDQRCAQNTKPLSHHNQH